MSVGVTIVITWPRHQKI